MRAATAKAHQPAASQRRRGAAHLDQAPQAGVHAARHARRIVPLGVAGLVTPWAVHPAAVVGARGVLGKAQVVERAHLIAQVDERDATRGQRHAVQQQDAGHRMRIALLQPAQRGAGAADAAIPSGGVVLERHAAGKAARKAVDVELVEKAPVVKALDAQARRVLVGKGPADVVMAAHVVDPSRALGQVMTLLQRLLQHVHLARGQRVPQQGHLQRVVGDLALARADVLHDVIGMDDGLGLEQQPRGGHARHGVEGADQMVGLGQVLAAGAQPLPDEGHGVHAQHLGAQVGNGQHLAGHGVEHGRVGVVQVPLKAVEGRPHPTAVLQLRERAGMLVGKDLPHRAVVGIGQRAVGEEQVKVLVACLAGHAALCPLVLVAGVVEDEVQHQADALPPQGGGQRAQVGQRAQGGVDLAVAADGVAAIAALLRALEGRHQVQVGGAELLQVGDLRFHTLQVTPVQVGIADGAQHLLGAEPGMISLSAGVQSLQVRRSVTPAAPGRLHQHVQHLQEVFALPIHRGQFRGEGAQVSGHPLLKSRPVGPRGSPGMALEQCGSAVAQQQGLLVIGRQHHHGRGHKPQEWAGARASSGPLSAGTFTHSVATAAASNRAPASSSTLRGSPPSRGR